MFRFYLDLQARVAEVNQKLGKTKYKTLGYFFTDKWEEKKDVTKIDRSLLGVSRRWQQENSTDKKWKNNFGGAEKEMWMWKFRL